PASLSTEVRKPRRGAAGMGRLLIALAAVSTVAVLLLGALGLVHWRQQGDYISLSKSAAQSDETLQELRRENQKVTREREDRAAQVKLLEREKADLQAISKQKHGEVSKELMDTKAILEDTRKELANAREQAKDRELARAAADKLNGELAA